jgi:hypothetical protein
MKQRCRTGTLRKNIEPLEHHGGAAPQRAHESVDGDEIRVVGHGEPIGAFKSCRIG